MLLLLMQGWFSLKSRDGCVKRSHFLCCGSCSCALSVISFLVCELCQPVAISSHPYICLIFESKSLQISCLQRYVAQKRDNIIKHSINSLQLLYHANPCNHVLQVLQTTSLVYIVFPYSGPGILTDYYGLCYCKPIIN